MMARETVEQERSRIDAVIHVLRETEKALLVTVRESVEVDVAHGEALDRLLLDVQQAVERYDDFLRRPRLVGPSVYDAIVAKYLQEKK